MGVLIKTPLNGYTLIEALEKSPYNDYDILAYYVSDFKGFNKSMKSNIRQGDTNGSLRFVKKNGKTIVSDFGYRTGMSIFDYLSEYLSCSKDDVFLRINNDFKLGLHCSKKNYKVAVLQKNDPIIHNEIVEEVIWDVRYKSRKLGSFEVDKEFWYDRYGITGKTLQLFNVVFPSDWWLVNNDKRIHFRPSNENPTYIYVPDKSLNIQGYKAKVYSPYIKDDGKWYNTLPKDTCLSLHTLPEYGDTLVIQKALKDAMCGYDMFRDLDVWFVELFAESVFLNPELFETLKKRFRRIIYHGDNDVPGIRQAKLFGESYGIEYVINPTDAPKDLSDMRWKWGLDETTKFLCKAYGL
jgi:hypothetical protein